MGKGKAGSSTKYQSALLLTNCARKTQKMIFDQMCVLVLKGSTGNTFLLVSLPPSPKASGIHQFTHHYSNTAQSRELHSPIKSIALHKIHWGQTLGFQPEGSLLCPAGCESAKLCTGPIYAQARGFLGLGAPGMQEVQSGTAQEQGGTPRAGGSCTYHSCKGWRSFYLSLHVLWHYLPKHIEQGIRRGYGEGPRHY